MRSHYPTPPPAVFRRLLQLVLARGAGGAAKTCPSSTCEERPCTVGSSAACPGTEDLEDGRSQPFPYAVKGIKQTNGRLVSRPRDGPRLVISVDTQTADEPFGRCTDRRLPGTLACVCPSKPIHTNTGDPGARGRSTDRAQRRGRRLGWGWWCNGRRRAALGLFTRQARPRNLEQVVVVSVVPGEAMLESRVQYCMLTVPVGSSTEECGIGRSRIQKILLKFFQNSSLALLEFSSRPPIPFFPSGRKRRDGVGTSHLVPLLICGPDKA
ncbi:hypothetical protein F4780DRAFT_755348 [Xylariomycetidae sp. FL0641]|nr:hypothetical protein F4780DRAFT_755348 [Xylariomycetidae sp. FL0641]